MSAYFTNRISVQQFKKLDVIDLRALPLPTLIEENEESDHPVVVIMPYMTYVCWQETISKAQKYAAELAEAVRESISRVQRADAPGQRKTNES
jgi:hypothetical protein